ncbi:L,D-transpeptidase family protein [Rubritalea spongiae]|uniref:L,D-transpeptidase family protein n=1 Tax=Rubritalea spongiae TaxID=430797 RepID=A0ABW5DYP8_9BACT
MRFLLFILPLAIQAAEIPALNLASTENQEPPRAIFIDEVTGEEIIIPKEREEGTRLQIYLDQLNFGPGVIDGKPGQYTKKAIATFNKKYGREEDDIASVQQLANQEITQIYAIATVPEAAKKYVDVNFRWGDDRSYQASRKDMPYRSIAEFMAERYHCSVSLLELFNGSKKINRLKIHDAIRVPNVDPFLIENMSHGRGYKEDPLLSSRWAVIDTDAHQIRIYQAINPPEIPQTAETQDSSEIEDQTPVVTSPEPPTRVVIADTSPEETPRAMIIEEEGPAVKLSEYDEDRAIVLAAFPITPGRPQFIRRGTWKMMNSIEFPTWRYDDSLLKQGVYSKVSLTIPSGPNSPVGVHWQGLSRRGIGIHGTSNPERIGRGRSAGCIRLANWDVVKMPKLIRPGATVIIK